MSNILIGFVLGYIAASCLIYLLNLGRSVLILKQTQYIAASIFSYLEECMIETTIYKEMALDESNLSDRQKEARRVLNRNTIRTIKDNSMKAFLNLWPDNYYNLLDYKNWDEMKSYIEKEAKKIRSKNDKNN